MIIKQCPHCGGEARINANYSRKAQGYFIFVKCEVCGAQGKTYIDAENPEVYGWEMPACQFAISAWNMRYGVTNEK